MTLHPTALPGCFRLDFPQRLDLRGSFVKTLHAPTFAKEKGVSWSFRESYYSTSNTGVIRGMHLQLPPHDHAKLVYCISGRVLDVVVDLRPGAGFGKHVSFEFSGDAPAGVYVPHGCAHGFLVLETATLVYQVTSEYAPSHDGGIRYDSFGFDWPVANPLISDRDLALPGLDGFVKK
jgi:dTDP-4-dehydrorhamnose 3,5-epimerase